MKSKRVLFIYISLGIGITITLSFAFLYIFYTFEPSYQYIYFKSTKQLYFGANCSEVVCLKRGGEISYIVESAYTPISFSIWNQPFDTLPKKTVHEENSSQVSITQYEYEYYSVFLRPGSSIFYNFTVISGNPIDFFISNGSSFYLWSQGLNHTFYHHIEGSLGENGNFSDIDKSQDYYIVWNNESPSIAIIDYILNYTATNVYDFSVTDVAYEKTYSVPQNSYSVPLSRSGNWSFFIYYDPLFSYREFTAITYNIVFKVRV